MKREHTRDRRRLGTSELYVSPLGLGCVQFSRGKGVSGLLWQSLSDNDIKEIVGVSLEGGINWFDTASSTGGANPKSARLRSRRA